MRDDGPTTPEIPPRAYCLGGCGRNIVDVAEIDASSWEPFDDGDGYTRVICPDCWAAR